MKTKLNNAYGLTELAHSEQININGGSIDGKPTTQTSFWNDVGFVLGAVAKGLVIFGTEGGRNAGLVVR